MSTLITTGAAVISPTLLLMLTEDSQGGGVIHQIVGRENPDVTLRPASLRSGTIEIGFSGATADAASAAAHAVLRRAAVFTLADSDRPSYNMTFVVPQSGRISRRIDDETRAAFTILLDYQECTA